MINKLNQIEKLRPTHQQFGNDQQDQCKNRCDGFVFGNRARVG